MQRRFLAASSAAFTLLLIAGCAVNPPASRPKGSENTSQTERKSYSGRLSLVIEPAAGSIDPAQTFSGSFELRGNPEIGELDLITPLGQIVMRLRWQPDLAMILRGDTRQLFANAQDLIQQATGASLSLEQLFAWLQGKNVRGSSTSSDWQVDLAAHANGRIIARRLSPTPAVLRIALEMP